MLRSDWKGKTVCHAIISLVIVISGFASVNGLEPFAYASYYAAVFAGLNPVALAPALILGAFLPSLKLTAIFSALISALVTSVVYFVLGKSFKGAGIPITALVIFLGQSAKVILAWYGGIKPVYVVIDLCLCYIYAYVAYSALKPIIQRGMRYNLIDTEIACLFLMVTVIAMSLASFTGLRKIPLLVVAAFFIPSACKLTSRGAGVMLGLAMGLGSAFTTLDVTDIALLGFVAISSCMFISAPRALSPLAQVFAVAVFELFFDVDYLSLGYHAGAMLVGGMIYALIPNKVMNAVGERFFSSHSGAAIRHVINRNRYELARSVETVGRVFEDMGEILGGMEREVSLVSGRVTESVIGSVCKNCPRFQECSELGLTASMSGLSDSAVKNGRATISDIPPLLVDKCLYIGKIMSEVTSLVAYERETAAKNRENNRFTALLATQMEGVSRILRRTGELTARPVSYDYELEKKVIEELRYYNIICSEALLCLCDKPTATLIIRRDCAEAERKLIAEVVGKIMRVGFSVRSVDDSLISGWSVVELESELKYDVLFGLASKPLYAEATGDTHSFMKVGGSKFLMAVCDGMGSGRRAYELSNKAMTLVESFYQAGFDHDLTVEGINRFLNFESGEDFSALDVAVLDLIDCKADLVKLAAPSSYVKKSDSVIRVDSSSLPLGVVGSVSPAVSTFELEDGDVLVLVSDGVSQRFEGDTLSAVINNAPGVNPQKLADLLLAEAEKRQGAPEDDMTVAVCRIFKRI